MRPHNRRSPRLQVTATVMLLILITYLWFSSPARIESLDSLVYCACGYSTVQFEAGRIIIVKDHHETVKPGEQIGTYRVVGNHVEMEIVLAGKAFQETLTMDNIGLVASHPSRFRYQALNSRSPKFYIYAASKRLGTAFARLWQH